MNRSENSNRLQALLKTKHRHRRHSGNCLAVNAQDDQGQHADEMAVYTTVFADAQAP